MTYVNLDKNRRPRSDSRSSAAPKYEGPDSSGPSSSPAEQEPGNGSSSGSILLRFSSAGITIPRRLLLAPSSGSSSSSSSSSSSGELDVELGRRELLLPPALRRRRSLRRRAAGGRLRRGRHTKALRDEGAPSVRPLRRRPSSRRVFGRGLARRPAFARPTFLTALRGTPFSPAFRPSATSSRSFSPSSRSFSQSFSSSPRSSSCWPGVRRGTRIIQSGRWRSARRPRIAITPRRGRPDGRDPARSSGPRAGAAAWPQSPWRSPAPPCWARCGSARPGSRAMRRGTSADLPLPVLHLPVARGPRLRPARARRPGGPRLRRGAHRGRRRRASRSGRPPSKRPATAAIAAERARVLARDLLAAASLVDLGRQAPGGPRRAGASTRSPAPPGPPRSARSAWPSPPRPASRSSATGAAASGAAAQRRAA